MKGLKEEFENDEFYLNIYCRIYLVSGIWGRCRTKFQHILIFLVINDMLSENSIAALNFLYFNN